MTAGTAQLPVYASACAAYYKAGWRGVIPVPPEAKYPPPKGFTGTDGRDITPDDLLGWACSQPGSSVALRMPDGVAGFDVDDYVKGSVVKRGAETMAKLEAERGPLPPTWSSTARGPGQPSRISFYRVPPGRYAGQLGPDVEVIQRHHRYAVVAPSPHHGAGADYAWYRPDGTPADPGEYPSPDDLPELLEAWVTYLAGGASAASGTAASTEAGNGWLEELYQRPDAVACAELSRTLMTVRSACASAEAGCRHDEMTKAVFAVVMAAAKGHPGGPAGLAELKILWEQLTAGENREAEFGGPSGMVLTAACKAVTEHGPLPAREDPCRTAFALPYQAPAPGVPPGEPEQPVAPPRTWSAYEAVGTHLFDPAGELDAVLARDVLARTWPALRFAPDAGAWLARGPEKWEIRKGNAAAWAVDLVSWLMPAGDPDADDGTPDKARAKRRARFATNASANAIAGKMSAQVAVGHHPSALELADLDSDREVLWAGGMAFALRACGDGPVLAAGYDPGTPHLHSAAVAPAVDPGSPAPLWDAFLAAVWPDEDMRAWALRVLSIAVTGYSDKALPIMLGETDHGKTSVIDLLMSVLGTYAHVADARLLSPADKAHASIVFALKGRRLSFIDEAPRAGSMANERLKQLTGGADLTGNQMQQNPVTWSPTHTLILTANPEHEPVLTDAAIRRRVRLVPCNGDPAEVIAKRAEIGNLNGPAWRKEAPVVLARMMAEAARWLADQLSAGNDMAPESGKAAAEEIRASQDHVMAWVRDECEDWAEGTRGHELFMAFTDSCRRRNVHPSAIPSETLWGRRLNDMGYPSLHRRDGRFRPLRVRGVHPFMPTQAEVTGASGGAAGPRDGYTRHSDGFIPPDPQPGTNGETADQTSHQTSHGDGLTGSDGYTRIRAHAHTHTQENGIEPSHPATRHGEAEPGEPSQPVTETKERKSRQRKPKIPDPELAGPVLSLPAVVTAEGRVMPCPVQTAEYAIGLTAGGDLTVDVETTGYPPGHPDYALRTVQLGHAGRAAVFDAGDPDQRAAVSRLIAGARLLRAHSASADLVPLDLGGLALAGDTWPKMHDTVLAAKLADPSMSGSDADGLKDLARDVLAGAACSPAADKRRSKLFTSGGWLGEPDALTPPGRNGWAQVNSACEAMITYAASDVLDTARIARQLPAPDPRVYERERAAQRICARVSHAGLALDVTRVRELIGRESAALEAAGEIVTGTYGIANPGSPKQVGAVMAELGAALPRTRPSTRFPQGQPSVAEAVLSGLARSGGEAGELAASILDYRDHATILGLTLKPFLLLCEHGDARTRPVIYTLAADTGRMCLPDAHGLVTPDGFVKPGEIRRGMQTFGADGNLTRVLAVHRYADQPVITMENHGLELAATAEHRWVTTMEDAYRRGSRLLRKLSDHPRLRVHLAPDAEPFDFSSRQIPAETGAQRFAALVGMLVTDGRCATSEIPETGMRAYVYQTERKHLAEFLRVIPGDALMYDRVTAGDHHELRIRTRWLRPRLVSAGLTAEPWTLLRESGSLYRWAARLPLDELRAFFAACWLSDGDSGNRRMSCGSVNLRAVLSMAACRLGAIARVYVDPPGQWSTGPRPGLSFRRAALSTRTTAFGSDRADVWCVTTEAGTFTAVSPQGTVYLTGNSARRPNLQQIKREGGYRSCITADPGCVLISADFASVEVRTMAALSQDQTLMGWLSAGDACTDEEQKKNYDLHWQVARMVHGPGATKSQRYPLKRAVFGHIYGGGAEAMANGARISLEQAQAVKSAIAALAPGLTAWDAQMREYVRGGGREFTAYSGRVIWLDRRWPHKAANYLIQGTAREFLVDALIEWEKTPWGGCVILPVHDELIAVVPEQDAQAATAALVACMQNSLAGVTIAAEPSPPSFAWQDAG